MTTIPQLGALSIQLAAPLALAGARPQGAPPTPPPATGAQEVTVLGVFADVREQPTIVLEGKRDHRRFAMAIGPAEATGIVLPLQNVTPPRPLTHDLFLQLFGRLNVRVTKAVVTDLRDGTYFAIVHLTANGIAIEMDARPSDAIALAIRARAPVYAEDQVFDKSRRPELPAVPAPRI
jgi:bifunctional DNase/RNase